MKYRIRSLAALTLGAAAAWQAATRQPAAQPTAESAEHTLAKALDYGTTAPVDIHANPHTRSVAEALQNGTHPERLSTLLRPAGFDREAFQANPSAYLDVVEPGRAFQVAQPGPGVPRLAALSPRYSTAVQGNEVVLQIAAAPRAPVTFTSFDLGTFHNGLTSISVQADERGVAQATLTGGPGTIADVHVQAASPLCSGQVRFTIHVTMPQ